MSTWSLHGVHATLVTIFFEILNPCLSHCRRALRQSRVTPQRQPHHPRNLCCRLHSPETRRAADFYEPGGKRCKLLTSTPRLLRKGALVVLTFKAKATRGFTEARCSDLALEQVRRLDSLLEPGRTRVLHLMANRLRERTIVGYAV